MTHSSDDEFRNTVDAFLERTGMSPSRFGHLSCADPNFVIDLRGGEREFKRSTIEKVQKWISGFETGVAFAVNGKLPSADRQGLGGDMNPAPAGV